MSQLATQMTPTNTPLVRSTPARSTPPRGDELQAQLCRNLRRLAATRRMTLSALAEAAGVAKAQLYRVVSGQSSPSLDWISKLARGLDIDPFGLLQHMPATDTVSLSESRPHPRSLVESSRRPF